jgi:N-acyl-D-aspartate/D-glutamate deacylase
MHDFVIENALIADGLGGAPYAGSLAIAGGRIAGLCRGPAHDLGAARQRIDAEGLVLAPGIIDGHTHYDAQITWEPMAAPSPAHGVTTIVIGNCGFTIAPCRAADRDLTMRNLTHVEGMSLDALRAGIRWDFESFPEYLAMLERRGVGPNVAAFVGHSSLRTYVLGADASSRVASDGEIAEMRRLVREAMAAGAVGFATSTNEPHNGENGVPMPSRLADDRELRGLVTAMGESGRGLFMLTKGTTTSIPYLETLAADSGRPVLIAALQHNPLAPDGVFAALREIAAARSRGRRLVGQVSCTPLSMEFTLESPYLFESFAAWKPAMAAQGEALRRIYGDPAFREAVKAQMAAERGRHLFNSEWDKVEVVEVADPGRRALEGRTIDLLAAAAGAHPLDWLLDLALAEDLQTLFTAMLLNADEGAVGRLVADPETHVALSDAGAHLTFLCDAGFGLHLLGHWVREAGAIGLGEAVRKLTSQPAALFGIEGRGRLAAGCAADLMLFDPATVGRSEKRRVRDLPTGAARLTTAPVGLHGVWVNGVRIADAAGPLPVAELPGRVLRDFAG